MERKNRSLQIYKWSAIALHCLCLFYSLTQPWYFVFEEFRSLWSEKIGYLCESRITLTEAIKMMWNGFDVIGKYRYFSDVRGAYNMFLTFGIFIIIFVCAEVYEIIKAFNNKIGGWFLLGEVVMIYAELMIFQMLYNFTGGSVEISEIMKFNYYIFVCELLPCIALAFEVKAASLSGNNKTPVSDIKVDPVESEAENTEKVIEKIEKKRQRYSKCPGCGAEINESWKYCQQCGCDLKKVGEKKKVLKFGGLIVCIVIGLIAVVKITIARANIEDERTCFSEYLSYEGKKVSALPNTFEAEKSNDENQGCMKKTFDELGEDWEVVYYYGVEKSGVLGLPEFQNSTVTDEAINKTYLRLRKIYKNQMQGESTGNHVLFCWNKVERGKYDLKFVIQRGNKSGQNKMSLIFTKCRGSSDHNEEALDAYMNALEDSEA